MHGAGLAHRVRGLSVQKLRFHLHAQALGKALAIGRAEVGEPVGQGTWRIRGQPAIAGIGTRGVAQGIRLAGADGGLEHGPGEVAPPRHLGGVVHQRRRVLELLECDLRVQRHRARVPLGGGTGDMAVGGAGWWRLAQAVGAGAQPFALGMRIQEQVDVAIVADRPPTDSHGVTDLGDGAGQHLRELGGRDRAIAQAVRQGLADPERGFRIATLRGVLEHGPVRVERASGKGRMWIGERRGGGRGGCSLRLRSSRSGGLVGVQHSPAQYGSGQRHRRQHQRPSPRDLHACAASAM